MASRCGCTGEVCNCAIVVQDSDCIDMTLTGNGTAESPYTISADPIIDPNSANCFVCGTSGLNLVVDPDPDNQLSCGPNGLTTTVTVEDLAVFTRTGTLQVTPGTSRFRFPFDATIINVTAAVGSAPTGADIIIDVNKNSTTIFTTQANRPRILDGTNETAVDAVPDITGILNGDFLTIDIDQVGSTSSGSELTAFILYSR